MTLYIHVYVHVLAYATVELLELLLDLHASLIEKKPSLALQSIEMSSRNNEGRGGQQTCTKHFMKSILKIPHTVQRENFMGFNFVDVQSLLFCGFNFCRCAHSHPLCTVHSRLFRGFKFCGQAIIHKNQGNWTPRTFFAIWQVPYIQCITRYMFVAVSAVIDKQTHIQNNFHMPLAHMLRVSHN